MIESLRELFANGADLHPVGGMRPFETPEGVVLPASCWRVFARKPGAR